MDQTVVDTVTLGGTAALDMSIWGLFMAADWIVKDSDGRPDTGVGLELGDYRRQGYEDAEPVARCRILKRHSGPAGRLKTRMIVLAVSRATR